VGRRVVVVREELGTKGHVVGCKKVKDVDKREKSGRIKKRRRTNAGDIMSSCPDPSGGKVYRTLIG